MKRYDINSQRFGRLIAIEPIGNGYWRCRCDCGSETRTSGTNLRSGHSQSCGCLRSEALRKPRGAAGHTAGGKPSITYTAWKAMHRRCSDPNFISYKHYGSRGISVCERWADFANFLADMGERPSRKHTIERQDGNGHYEPGNCCWATYAEQSNNKRNNRFVEWNGRRQTVAQWAKELGLSAGTIQNRLNRGVDAEEIFSDRSLKLIEINGQFRKVSDWCKDIGISVPTFYKRKKQGWSLEKIVSTPLKQPQITLKLNGREQTLIQWAKELNLRPGTIHQRLRRGCTDEQALAT